MYDLVSPTSPIYCVTADLDWASDWAIEDLLKLLAAYRIRPTLFATHRSPTVTAFEQQQPLDVGLHPNFLPGSTHGRDEDDIIRHLHGDFPKAETYRAHCFYDHSHLQARFRDLGFRYDSNLCLFLQCGLSPLRLASGLTRFPVFWEDDVHWKVTDGDWSVARFFPHFVTPGLKILNVHPFFIAANVPGADYYLAVKSHIKTISPETVAAIRWPRQGARSFLKTLLERLLQHNASFLTLAEIYRRHPVRAL